MSADVARRRRTKAFALVISLFLVLWLCGMANPSRVSTNAAAAGDASGSTASTGDVLGRALALIEDGEGQPPETFMREVGVLEGCRGVRAKGRVVGYLVDEEASEALARISESIEARGWEERPMEGIIGSVFAKKEGEYTWALVTCNQVGIATSVVVRCG